MFYELNRHGSTEPPARDSSFPEEWGTPPGTPLSNQRAAWVLERVNEHKVLQRLKRRAACLAQQEPPPEPPEAA
ncbi:hypothetical protein OG730_04480 [Streptomyces sp. NBC_01298]|uniref:hypothetical protein n=1 Tax=Streptomyces sp. NBC_01298 TaxID=2903817 RepID=UPI002E16839D|nr:hypothetical protein OG730_04480 [Streptomyces sp. NBC_01298]